MAGFARRFRLHQQTAKTRTGVYPFLAGEVAMAKKSLARYVSEIRKELLARNCQAAATVSDHASVQAKPVKAGGSKANGDASRGQKGRRP